MKIYNVKMVKTEMARGPPKHCRNQNPFGSLQTYPQADSLWVGPYLFVKNAFFVVHPKLRIFKALFFVRQVPRLPTLPAAVVQIFLCLAQIGM